VLNTKKFDVDALLQNFVSGKIVVDHSQVKGTETKQILSELSDSIDNYIFATDIMILPTNSHINRTYLAFTKTLALGILRYKDQISLNNTSEKNQPSQISITNQNNIININQIIQTFEQIKQTIEKDQDIDEKDKMLLVEPIKDIISSGEDNGKKISNYRKILSNIAKCSDKIFSKPYVIQILGLVGNALLSS
jgi:hypothetical protein